MIEVLNKLRGNYLGDGYTSFKVADLKAALEAPRLTKQEVGFLQGIKVSLECAAIWIENGCTRGPEAEEIRLNIKKLQEMFPEAFVGAAYFDEEVPVVK